MSIRSEETDIRTEAKQIWTLTDWLLLMAVLSAGIWASISLYDEDSE